MEKKIKLRQEANALLNSVVNIVVCSYPQLRYVQILWNIGIIDSNYVAEDGVIVIDRHYEEPIDTLIRCYDKIVEYLTKTNNLYLKEEIDKLINNE